MPDELTQVGVPDRANSTVRPWRILIKAVLLFAATMVIAVVVVVIAGVVYLLATGRPSASITSEGPRQALEAGVTFAFETGLGVASWVCARTPSSNALTGLGFRRIQRPWSLIAITPIVLVASTLCARVLQSQTGLRLSQHLIEPAAFTGGPATSLAFSLLLMAILPAIAEEMFFRGWLWEALARRWRPFHVAVATTLLFLLAHFDGSSLPIFLVPLAAALAYVRYRSGSLWASGVVHLVNNVYGLSGIHLPF